jgi:hypothetical protein
MEVLQKKINFQSPRDQQQQQKQQQQKHDEEDDMSFVFRNCSSKDNNAKRENYINHRETPGNQITTSPMNYGSSISRPSIAIEMNPESSQRQNTTVEVSFRKTSSDEIQHFEQVLFFKNDKFDNSHVGGATTAARAIGSSSYKKAWSNNSNDAFGEPAIPVTSSIIMSPFKRKREGERFLVAPAALVSPLCNDFEVLAESQDQDAGTTSNTRMEATFYLNDPSSCRNITRAHEGVFVSQPCGTCNYDDFDREELGERPPLEYILIPALDATNYGSLRRRRRRSSMSLFPSSPCCPRQTLVTTTATCETMTAAKRTAAAAETERETEMEIDSDYMPLNTPPVQQEPFMVSHLNNNNSTSSNYIWDHQYQHEVLEEISSQNRSNWSDEASILAPQGDHFIMTTIDNTWMASSLARNEYYNNVDHGTESLIFSSEDDSLDGDIDDDDYLDGIKYLQNMEGIDFS